MKVVFMGTPDFAAGCLSELINNNYDVAAVVTQPDKPKGRGKELAMSDVKKVALEHNLTIYQPVKVRDPEFVEILKGIAPDVIVVVAFGQIISKEILDMPRYGCINIHGSLLPAYRGAAPIQWAVIDGLKTTGVTSMYMNEGIDTGDIIMTREIELDKKETGGSLFDRLCVEGSKLLIETLIALENNTATRTLQDDSKSNYAKKLDKTLGNLDFTSDAISLERLVRGLNPWPSAYTHINGKTLKIWDCDVVSAEYTGECGEIVEIGPHKEYFIVRCGLDALKVNEIQLEGKKRMKVEDFLRGYNLEVGTILQQ